MTLSRGLRAEQNIAVQLNTALLVCGGKYEVPACEQKLLGCFQDGGSAVVRWALEKSSLVGGLALYPLLF